MTLLSTTSYGTQTRINGELGSTSKTSFIKLTNSSIYSWIIDWEVHRAIDEVPKRLLSWNDQQYKNWDIAEY